MQSTVVFYTRVTVGLPHLLRAVPLTNLHVMKVCSLHQCYTYINTCINVIYATQANMCCCRPASPFECHFAHWSALGNSLRPVVMLFTHATRAQTPPWQTYVVVGKLQHL